MATPETTDAARAAGASGETPSEADAQRAREADARRRAERHEEIVRLRAEAAERAARDQAEQATQRRRAELAAAKGGKTREGIRLEAVEGAGNGKQVKVHIPNRDGVLVDVEKVFGIPESVRMVYGTKLGLDAETGFVTVPVGMRQEDLPLLARELIRAAKHCRELLSEEAGRPGERRAADERAVVIQKEIDARRKLETEVKEMRDEYRFFDFSEMRDRYARLEVAHSETVRKAEKAIDDLLPGLASEYAHVTGRDLYQDAGGEARVKDQVRRRLLAEQAGLVFKYDKKGNRHLLGTPGEGVRDSRDLSMFDQAVRLWNSSETVQDYRVHRKMLRRFDEEEEFFGKVKLAADKAGRWPGQMVFTFGKTGLMATLAAGAWVIDQPRKLLTWGLDQVDGVATGMINAVGKWWRGKDFTPSISSGDRRSKSKDAISKMADDKFRG